MIQTQKSSVKYHSKFKLDNESLEKRKKKKKKTYHEITRQVPKTKQKQ